MTRKNQDTLSLREVTWLIQVHTSGQKGLPTLVFWPMLPRPDLGLADLTWGSHAALLSRRSQMTYVPRMATVLGCVKMTRWSDSLAAGPFA